MTTLSQPAVLALIELEHGASFNCMHTISRELIEGGFAFDGWDKLEITEMGRRAARTFRSFKASDPNISSATRNQADNTATATEPTRCTHQCPTPSFDAPNPNTLPSGLRRLIPDPRRHSHCRSRARQSESSTVQ